MNKLFGTLLFFFVGSIASATCPDISGNYLNSDAPNDQGIFHFEQTDCTTLVKSMGILTKDGSLELYNKQEYLLDGTAVCKGYACENVTATADGIAWKINYNSSVNIPKRGKCYHNGYLLSKTEDGDLKAVFQVRDCYDRYEGPAEKIFKRL